MNDLKMTEENGKKDQTSTVTDTANNEQYNGFFDMISSALPTIGKVAMNVFSSFANGEQKGGCYTVLSSGQDGNNEAGLHFINDNGKTMAVNNSLSKAYSINIPAKGNNPIVEVVLPPFHKLDMTEDLREASNANIQRFGVMGIPNEAVAGLNGFGSGVFSCIAYVTKSLLCLGKKLNAHITLKAINDDLQITLSVDLNPISCQSFIISAINGGEQKRFNAVKAISNESDENDSNSQIILKDALKGFQKDDDLEIVGDVLFENKEGKCLIARIGTFLTEEDVNNYSAAIRR